MFEGIALSVSGNNIDELIDKVASKKGTTEAGLRSFKQNKLFRPTFKLRVKIHKYGRVEDV